MGARGAWVQKVSIACQKWFACFRAKNFNLNDEERSGRPQGFESQALEELLDEDPSQSTRQLAARLQVDRTTVLDRLYQTGKIL